MHLLDKVRADLLRTGLIGPGEAVLLAVSGGADSVAMTHLLHRLSGQLELALFLAHFNHRLRGQEAEEDALFVERLGRDLGLTVFAGREDVSGLARRRKLGLQEAARQARFDFLEKTAAHVGCRVIALAHNLEDQAETLLLRLFAGAGLKGLGGMAPVRPIREGSPIQIIRPLLGVSRAEIEAFLEGEGLAFRTDSSNLKAGYRRNRLRLKTMPHLRRNYNPALSRVLARTSDQLRQDSEYLEELAARVYDRAVKQGTPDPAAAGLVVLDLAILGSQPRPLVTRVLARAFRLASVGRFELEADHLDALIRLMEGDNPSASVDLPGRVRAVREYGKLTFEAGATRPRTAGEAPVAGLPVIRITEVPLTGLRVPVRPGRELLVRVSGAPPDNGEAFGAPLAIRTRRPGDWLSRSDGSTKKLQDFMVEKKVPLRIRDELLLVAAGSRVLWVEGLYQDQLCAPKKGRPGLEIILEEVPFD